MQVVLKSAAPAVAPGTYSAQFVEIDERTSAKDDSDFWVWKFRLDDGTPLSGSSSTNTGPMSKSYKWFSALLARTPAADEPLDTATLAGRTCLLVIETSDTGFAKVADVVPAPRGADLDDIPF